MPSPSMPLSMPVWASLHPTKQPLPLFADKVPAGFPSPATDHMDQRLDLSEHIVTHPDATFFLRVKSDSYSMTGAGIHPGDLLVVDRSLEPISGRVVVADINGELTVKRLHKRGDTVTLKAENPAYHDIQIKEGQELRICGVVAYVVHAP